MTTRCFADLLVAPEWQRIRALRREIKGEDAVVLRDDDVPEPFVHLLPYASLLHGEEALYEFWDAMSRSARNELMRKVDAVVEELRDFCLSGPAEARIPERDALLDLVRVFDYRLQEWSDSERALNEKN